jgi:hypothetical protein
MEFSGREKRRYPRIEHHYIIRFKEANSDAERDISNVRNISKSGMLFCSNTPFETGAELEISMKVPPLTKESAFRGTVVRCTARAGATNLYDVAINISEIDEATRGAFEKAIKFIAFNVPGKIR